MTQPQVRKAGRPPKQLNTNSENAQTPALAAAFKKEESVKIGTFISLNTINVKGLRLNLDKVFSYAPNGDTSIQFAQGDGNNTTLTFGSKEEMLKVLEQLDARCQ